MEKSFLVRLPMGEDLLGAITSEFQKRSVQKASFQVIGAVANAVLGYYDCDAKEYRFREFQGHFEILACVGNVSRKDGEVFVHAHITLAGPDYAAFGGHLMSGSSIFAAELAGTPVPGHPHVREFDGPTGLYLWSTTEPASDSD